MYVEMNRDQDLGFHQPKWTMATANTNENRRGIRIRRCWFCPPDQRPRPLFLEMRTSMLHNNSLPLPASPSHLLQILVFSLDLRTTRIATTPPTSMREGRYRDIKSLIAIFQLVSMWFYPMNGIRTSFHGWWVGMLLWSVAIGLGHTLHVERMRRLTSNHVSMVGLIKWPQKAEFSLSRLYKTCCN